MLKLTCPYYAILIVSNFILEVSYSPVCCDWSTACKHVSEKKYLLSEFQQLPRRLIQIVTVVLVFPY